MSIKEHISGIDSKVELLQEYLLGLESKKTYSEMT